MFGTNARLLDIMIQRFHSSLIKSPMEREKGGSYTIGIAN